MSTGLSRVAFARRIVLLRLKLGAGSLVSVVLLAAFGAYAQTRAGAPAAPAPTQSAPPAAQSAITVSAGTRILLQAMRPMSKASARPDAMVYLQTTFPVLTEYKVAIPAGTYVQGKLKTLKAKHERTELQMSDISFIWADGYMVTLPSAVVIMTTRADRNMVFETGTPLEMTLQSVLTVEASRAAAPAGKPTAVSAPPTRRQARCRPGTGTPGTPDIPGTPSITIPGTPGTPGTPDSPGTPGTPDIYIPGTPTIPGTPAVPCVPM